MGRTREEVQEWVVDSINRWYDSDILEEISDIHVQLADLQNDIADGKMLYKEQASLLHKLLELELEEKLDNPPSVHSSKILWVDELSIYADVWARYCRPGTYMIVQ